MNLIEFVGALRFIIALVLSTAFGFGTRSPTNITTATVAVLSTLIVSLLAKSIADKPVVFA